MSNNDVTITGSSKIQVAFIGAIIATVAGMTAYIVSIKNDVDVVKIRTTALELQREQDQAIYIRQRDEDREEYNKDKLFVNSFMTRIETKLDIFIEKATVKK